MNEGREFWQKYCAFFDENFSEQLEYNQKKKEEYFEKWKKTKMARQLCPEGVKKFEDVPLTTYDDYPILHKFGKEIEKLEKTVPRNKGELWWDYYDTIGKQVSPMLDGWMVDEYAFCAKTPGTTGKSKWYAHGESFQENISADGIAMMILVGSDGWGTTRLSPGDRYLNMLAPAPYIAGLGATIFAGEFELIPSPRVMDDITNLRKKLSIAIKAVERGEKIDIVGGIVPSIKMVCDYFTKPDELYKDYYQSMKLGVAKVFLYLTYLRHKLVGRKYKKAKDILPAKAVGCGGVGAKIYFNYLEEQFEIEPGHAYISTETGISFLSPPERKKYLFPILRSCYFEWLTESGKIKGMNELSKNETYELVATPFGSMVVRFRMGDLFRVAGHRGDGLPYFEVEGRKTTMLDFFGYFRLSEVIVTDAMIEAGLQTSDKWCAQKVMEPKEHLLILMENVWEISREKAERRIFEALRTVLPDFQSYVNDFGIKSPSKILEVEYLRKGAFMRYSMRRMKEGVPLGQIKLPKVVPEEKRKLADLLREV